MLGRYLQVFENAPRPRKTDPYCLPYKPGAVRGAQEISTAEADSTCGIYEHYDRQPHTHRLALLAHANLHSLAGHGRPRARDG